MDLDVLRVKFTHSNTVRDKRPYTIYEIEVRSSSTITWVIYKRYSSFYVLHQALVTSLLSLPGGKNVKLPNVPPKRLTRSLASEFVEKRKLEQEEYLKGVLNVPQVLQCEPMLSFLEVPDSVRPMLSRGFMRSADGREATSDKQDVAEKVNFPSKSVEERRVLELIQALKTHPNKVSAQSQFESFFFMERPRLSAEMIHLLLEGIPGKQNGLLHTCGDFRHSRVASRSALRLLGRLLDAERNKDSVAFVEQLCQTPTSTLQKIKFHVHILSARGNKAHAFKVIHVIMNHLRSQAGSTNPPYPSDLTIEAIVQDQAARIEYSRWESRFQHFTVSNGRLNSKNEGANPLFRVGQHKSLCTSGFLEVLQLAETDKGWSQVSITSPFVHLSYRRDNPQSLFNNICVRASAIINDTVENVTNFLTETTETAWDPKIRSCQVLKRLDDATDLVHLVLKSFASFYKGYDFSLLRSISRLDDGGVILLYRSIETHKCPEVRDAARCYLKPSGYIVTPMANTSDGEPCCLLTYLLQLDRESVLIVSQDLLGESDEIVQAMQNINTVLRSRKTNL